MNLTIACSILALTPASMGQGEKAVAGTLWSPAYRANDGGAVYVRRDNDKLFWFAEHPGKDYAHVFSGKISGGHVEGKFWDVPKGGATSLGTARFRIDDSGQTLNRVASTGSFPFTQLKSFPIDSIPFPKGREAGFYSTSPTDLDGAWDCSNGGRYYVRETDGVVIWFAERYGLYDRRPTWAQVYIGERLTEDVVRGVYVDVPKGTTQTSGKTELWTRDAPFRVRDWKGENPRWWTKDMVDFDKFAANIDREFRDKCIGYGFAIFYGGNMVRYGGGGNRLQGQDGGPESMDHRTQKDAQSTSKSLTAMAVAHALFNTKHDTNTDIASYLPHTWKEGPGVKYLKFRDLLQHRSGLKGVGDPDEYGNLKKTISNGVVGKKGEFDYQNANYAMFRILLPYLVDWKGMRAFEKSVNYNETKVSEECSRRFIAYAKKHLFAPTGSPLVNTDYSSNNLAYAYNFKRPDVKGYVQQKNQWLECGAGAWVLSAEQFGRVLAAFDNGRIVSMLNARMMKKDSMGMRTANGALGAYYYHGGSIGGDDSDSYGSGRGAQAIWMIYPNNVQVMVQVNSANNAYRSRVEIMRDAFDKALLPR